MPGRAPPKYFAAEHRPPSAVGTAPNGLLLGAVCVLLAILMSACSPSALNSITFADGQKWSASFSVLQNASNPGMDLSALETSLRMQGIKPVFSQLAQTGQDGASQFQLSGSGGPAQLRKLLFGQLASLADPLGGPTSVTLRGMVHAGQEITFRFEANPSAGYLWEPLDYSADWLGPEGTVQFQPHNGEIGGIEEQAVQFTALKDGLATLRWVYHRPWEGEDLRTERILLVQAPELKDISDWSNPLAPPEVFSLPLSQDIPAPQVEIQTSATLPVRLDWRNRAMLTGIRNQGSCGGCWAFATVGALESAISIEEGAVTDLSEQYLLSCNTSGWSCSGGFTAHDWHMNLPGLDQSTPGAVLESSFPFADSNFSPTKGTTACSGPYNHPYQIKSWGYVGNTLTPSAGQIKQALLQYGPLATTVCVGPAFSSYKSGVFSTDEKSSCGGSVNHAVDLVGWDDTQGAHGAWILRNSWGTGWGDQGYMLIDRAASNIGYAASYVDFQPSGGPALPANSCPATKVLSCGDQVQGRNDQSGSTNLVSSYACSTQSETGPEVTYRFVPPADGTMTASLDFSEIGADGKLFVPSPPPDLDLFALNASGGSCQSKDCQAFGDNQLSVSVKAGQPVYLAVDGNNGAVGDYTLSVQCSAPQLSSYTKAVFIPLVKR